MEREEQEKPVLVYNFELEDSHTYYVSEFGVLVYNTCLIESGKYSIIVSQDRLQHSVLGEFNGNGGHGQANTGNESLCGRY